MKSRLLGAVCVFIYAILSSGQVISATINFSTLDFPGATGTQARGINNAGQVVGFYYDASGEQHGFLKDSSGYTTIDYPGAVTVNLYGINNNGQILGVYSTGDNTIHGFIKSGSSYTTFDHPDTDLKWSN